MSGIAGIIRFDGAPIETQQIKKMTAAMMQLTDKITIAPQAVARKVGEELVILHLNSGTYFGLDPVGARIWELIGEDKTLAEICEVLLKEYDVPREDLERDTINLLEDLLAQDLITPS